MSVAPRSILLHALLGALASIPKAVVDATRAATVRNFDSPIPTTYRGGQGAWGSSDKRYRCMVDGKLVKTEAGGSRPAVGYQQLAPKIDGVRMRWEDGMLVPRNSRPLSLPPTERKKQRARDRSLKFKDGQVTRRVRVPAGVIRRNDLKGAKRAARRAGLISPRQQRKYHRWGPQA